MKGNKKGLQDVPQTLFEGWLGRQGSNLGMLESKSSALPLGDAPIFQGGK